MHQPVFKESGRLGSGGGERVAGGGGGTDRKHARALGWSEKVNFRDYKRGTHICGSFVGGREHISPIYLLLIH